MKTYHIFCRSLLGLFSLLMVSSCHNSLDLAPIDHYGSVNFWEKEEQVSAFVDGLHLSLRAKERVRLFLWELSGGAIKQAPTGADGNFLLRIPSLSEENIGVYPMRNYGGYYEDIANINLYLSELKKVSMPAERKNYYLAIGYGLRAFYYFELYQAYGGVPIRTVSVVTGDSRFDVPKLYGRQSTAEETLQQIKADLTESYQLFGSQTSFDPLGRGNKKAIWSKAATEMLMGQVYLWSAKVTTGNHKANEADLVKAKQHLENLTSLYGLALMDNFADVFEAKQNKGNKELIFVIRYAEGEAENLNSFFLYGKDSGSSRNDFLADGSVFGDPLNVSGGKQLIEYRSGLYDLYEEGDIRRDATFLASYKKREGSDELYRYGTHVRKNIGYVNGAGQRSYCGDIVIYRLPEVYLMLAEIANMQGDNASVARYVNLVRKRAYGSAYDEARHAYVAGDFTQNELAILRERDKEFVQEGKRWSDLIRMTLTKGGKQLVFCVEAAIDEEGFTPRALLNEASEAHRVLFPLDKTLLDDEKYIYQTPGYESAKPRP